MMGLRIVMLACGFIGGIVLATVCRAPLAPVIGAAAVALGAGLSLWLYRAERRWVTPARWAVALAAVLLALPFGFWRTQAVLGHPRQGSLTAALAGVPARSPVRLRGTVAAEPDAWNERRVDLRLRVQAVCATGETWQAIAPDDVLLRVELPRAPAAGDHAAFRRLADPLTYGYTVEVETRYEPTANRRNREEFSARQQLQQEGLVETFRTAPARVTVLAETRGRPLTELALTTKRSFLVTFRETVRSPALWLVAGATLGNRHAVYQRSYAGKDISLTFRQSGVGHVLAVSGLHVSIITVLLYYLFTLTKLRPRVFIPPLILFLVLFALLTGARPSSTRAVVMNSIVLACVAYLRLGGRAATGIGLAVSSLLILALNPLVLYAPSFLLSFGAVLSLVVLTSPLDRWLLGVRGFALVGAVAWLAGLTVLASANLRWLLNPWQALGCAGWLWLLLALGRALNARVRGAWAVGVDRLPLGVRFMFGAQLAIQLGMMIPLSAWYFGQFPVAGMLTNLLAIPLVGVVVQLGIMTGLAGMLPLAGAWLAAPLGAATTFAADLFYRIAWFGSELFNYPATPRPALTWLAGYYALIGVALAAGHPAVRGVWQTWLHRLGTRRVPRAALGLAGAGLPVLLALLPLVPRLAPAPVRGTRVLCLAAGSAPVVAVVNDGGSAQLVNAGDWSAGNTAFATLRAEGAVEVEHAVLCSPEPELGLDGLTALAGKLTVRRAWLTVAPEDPETYLEAVGDAYWVEQAARGRGAYGRYARSYARLRGALEATDTAVQALQAGALVTQADVRVTCLPQLERWPKTFVASARTGVISLEAAGYRWLIVTDSTPAALRAALAGAPLPADVVVIADLSWRKGFEPLLDTVVNTARPRAVVFCGARFPRTFAIRDWARAREVELFHTAEDGAIRAVRTPAGALRLETYLSARTVTLAAPAPLDEKRTGERSRRR